VRAAHLQRGHYSRLSLGAHVHHAGPAARRSLGRLPRRRRRGAGRLGGRDRACTCSARKAQARRGPCPSAWRAVTYARTGALPTDAADERAAGTILNGKHACTHAPAHAPTWPCHERKHESVHGGLPARAQGAV